MIDDYNSIDGFLLPTDVLIEYHQQVQKISNVTDTTFDIEIPFIDPDSYIRGKNGR